MSKKKATQAETMTLWLTRDEGATYASYRFWLSKPRKNQEGDWNYNQFQKSVCVEIFHRRFPKAWRLKLGGGPLECVLAVRT